MTELAYYKALSLLLYFIVAVMFYRKIKAGIKTGAGAELSSIFDDAGIDRDTGTAASKTVAFVMCLFWPVSFLFAALVKKGGPQ